MKLLWMTDLHLERASNGMRIDFLKRLSNEAFDSAVLTGDISNAERLPEDLTDLGRACFPRKLYFTLGNHDFFGSSFAAVDASVEAVCQRQKNLHHLGSARSGEVIQLSYDTALVGHRGWADMRAGYSYDTAVSCHDAAWIDDLRICSSRYAIFRKMETLGRNSAAYFRRVLPRALSPYRHVFLATHVPPVTQVARYDGKGCGYHHQPYFCNVSAGGAIIGIARMFPSRRLSVLCGHTHSAASIQLTENLAVHVGNGKPGRPEFSGSFDLPLG